MSRRFLSPLLSPQDAGDLYAMLDLGSLRWLATEKDIKDGAPSPSAPAAPRCLHFAEGRSFPQPHLRPRPAPAAYRKASLKYHPDKCNIGIATEEEKARRLAP